jgi:hypothetical protein
MRENYVKKQKRSGSIGENEDRKGGRNEEGKI